MVLGYRSFLRVARGLLPILVVSSLVLVPLDATGNEDVDSSVDVGGAAAVAPLSFAEDGDGAYKGIIDWIEWGARNNEVVLKDGSSTKTVTSTRQIGANTLTVTCTIKDLQHHQPQGTGPYGADTGQTLTPPLVAYTPGSWAGDALDNLYNRGGAGYAEGDQPTFPGDFSNPNQMVIGLGNPNVGLSDNKLFYPDGTQQNFSDTDSNGANMSFDFSCEAMLDDVQVPLEGLVFADAEASSGQNVGNANPNNGPEWVQARTDQRGVNWRIIERARTCEEASTVVEWPDSNTMRLAVDGQECVYQNGFDWPQVDPDGHGPMAIAFMEGATSARVGLQGRGYSAVAVGYILSADFGDAPESYGTAGALFQQDWQGGTVESGHTPNVSADDFELAKPHDPTHVILGSLIDAEPQQRHSDDALGDDLADQPDEDGLESSSLAAAEFALPIDAYEKGTYTVTGISCHGGEDDPAHVAGWIDWNANGVFDDEERASTSCEGADQRVSLTWNNLADIDLTAISAQHTFMRVRIALNEAEIQSPTGMSVTGEVEDYRLQMPARLNIDKQWVVNGDSHPHGEQPDGLDASPTLTPDPDHSVAWGEWQRGYRVGDTVSVGEEVTIDPLAAPGCVLESSTLTGAGVDHGIDLNLGEKTANVHLSQVSNTYLITNTVTCDPGVITWTKVGADDAESPLAGSAWQLTGVDGQVDLAITDCVLTEVTSTCSTELDTDERAGYFRVENLPWGEYELVETKAPAGYLLDDTPRTITVGPGSVPVSLGPITNEPREAPALPLTGGIGASDYFLIGGGVVLLGIIALAMRRIIRS